MTGFAVECFADENIFKFLLTSGGLPLKLFHRSGQGEVVNAVLVGWIAEIGMVDEDPHTSHHKMRDQTSVVWARGNIEFRELNQRYLIIVKPELETCFLTEMNAAGLTSSFTSPPAMAQSLALPGAPAHAVFQSELIQLYDHCVQTGVPNFLKHIEDAVRSALPAAPAAPTP